MKIMHNLFTLQIEVLNEKILLVSAPLLTTLLNAEVIDAKQLFNKKTVKSYTRRDNYIKEFLWCYKIDESSVLDVVSRFDGYITNLYANKSYMSIKRVSLYIQSIQMIFYQYKMSCK